MKPVSVIPRARFLAPSIIISRVTLTTCMLIRTLYIHILPKCTILSFRLAPCLKLSKPNGYYNYN